MWALATWFPVAVVLKRQLLITGDPREARAYECARARGAFCFSSERVRALLSQVWGDELFYRSPTHPWHTEDLATVMHGAQCATYKLKPKEKADLAALKARQECLVSVYVYSHGNWPGWGQECWESKLPGCTHAPAVKARFRQVAEAMDKRSPEPARTNKFQLIYAGLTIVREVFEWIFQAPTPHFRAVLNQTRWPADAQLRVGIHIRWCVDCGYARMTESLVLKVGERNARARARALSRPPS